MSRLFPLKFIALLFVLTTASTLSASGIAQPYGMMQHMNDDDMSEWKERQKREKLKFL